MTEPTGDKLNETDSQQLSSCQTRIKPVAEKLRLLLRDAPERMRRATSPDERQSLEADICLASRSAYFDFYTWVVLNGTIDEPAKGDLDGLFQAALGAMQPGQFMDSVNSRYKEFKDLCSRVETGSRGYQTSQSR